MCLPSGRCQFNGTETLAHCNCLPQLVQAIPACLTAATAPAPKPAALAGDANGSAAAPAAQTAMSMNGTLRILVPLARMPGALSLGLCLTNCSLNHDQCQQP